MPQDNRRPERAVVTGGAGFIGSHVCRGLLEAGYEVVCLDDLSTGNRENLATLSSFSRFHFERSDITSLDSLVPHFEDVTAVLHFAAQTSVTQSVADPVACARVNISGFMNVLEAARRAGARRVVYASSSAVYGRSGKGPVKESEAGDPLSPYGLSKLVDEQLASLYGRLHGLTTVGLRYFNVYGPRQPRNGDYAAVVPRFIEALDRGEPGTIYGDGKQTRDFVYVADVVRANLSALGAELEPGTAAVVNVGSGRPTSVRELFEAVKRVFSETSPEASSIKPRIEPARVGDILHSCADVTRARKLLGFRTEWALEKGLAETVAWARTGRGSRAA